VFYCKTIKDGSSVHRVAESGEILHVGAEDEVAELRERKEDNAEHDGKVNEILRRTVDWNCQDAHGLDEVEVFEQLRALHIHTMIASALGDNAKK